MNAQSPDIAYEDATHRYTVTGQEVPHVTEILSEVYPVRWRIPSEALALAAAYGQAVHKMVELDVRGTLDETALDAKLRPVLDRWRSMRSEIERGGGTLQPEVIVANVAPHYAGRLDLILFHSKKPIKIIDIKTGNALPDTVGMQTAAYAHAYADMHGVRYTLFRAALTLTVDDARLYPLSNASDWNYFLAACNVYNWRKKHGTLEHTHTTAGDDDGHDRTDDDDRRN